MSLCSFSSVSDVPFSLRGYMLLLVLGNEVILWIVLLPNNRIGIE